MKVAVLIPCYNAEKYLGECLDSVLAAGDRLVRTQPKSAFDVFCCDDGSTDATRRILDDYATKHPNLHVSSHPNRGVSATRNRLMDELPADVEAFAFCDADDFVAPEAYAALAEAMARTGADVAEMCGPPGGRVIDDMSVFLLRGTAPGPWINCWNKLYRRASVGGVRFRAGLAFEEDFYFNYEIHAKIARKVLVPGSYYTYRHNPDSATGSPDFNRYFASASTRIRLSSSEFLEAGRIPAEKVPAFRRELAKDAYRMCIRKSLKKNRDAKSRRELFLAAADFFDEMEREHGFQPVGLNIMQRLLYFFCRRRLYAPARLLVALT